MPLYVYRCSEGHELELLQGFDGEPPEACDCGSRELERVLSPVAVRFHGSGFYTTDYGRPSAGEPAPA